MKIITFLISGVLLCNAVFAASTPPAQEGAAFAHLPTSQSTTHTVQNSETLGKIAKRYGTTVELIKQINGLEKDTIRVGQKLSVWTGKFSIYVSKSKNILALKSGEETVKEYPVSTGKDSSTPEGEFTITEKLIDPVWYYHGKVIPPGSKDNLLGSRWMGFDKPSYGIHGTVEPELIGQPVSAGCVRMINRDVEELYSLVPRGTKVVIEN